MRGPERRNGGLGEDIRSVYDMAEKNRSGGGKPDAKFQGYPRWMK